MYHNTPLNKKLNQNIPQPRILFPLKRVIKPFIFPLNFFTINGLFFVPVALEVGEAGFVVELDCSDHFLELFDFGDEGGEDFLDIFAPESFSEEFHDRRPSLTLNYRCKHLRRVRNCLSFSHQIPLLYASFAR